MLGFSVRIVSRFHIRYKKGVVTTVSCPAGPSSCPPGAYAGFVTSAVETGASILKIQEGSRHKSVDVLSGYVRRVDLFKDHAGAGFL